MEVTDKIKKEIFELITIPGMEIKDISKKLHIEYDKVMELLSEEYLKYDLGKGRRMCCRF